MSLTLYFHRLSSFCQKALIALYELGVPFEKRVVDLGDARERAAFLEVWPLGKFPVVRDDAHGTTVPETSIIIEYVQRRHAPTSQLIPSDPERAHLCRLRDRFFDWYIDVPMGKIVTDKLRPDGAHDALGVEQARPQLETAYSIADEWLREGPWAIGDTFTMADCAAAPALFYANEVAPFVRDARWRHLGAYWARLAERPSYVRVANEAKPYLSMFPG